jgi:hypothetical protein
MQNSPINNNSVIFHVLRSSSKPSQVLDTKRFVQIPAEPIRRELTTSTSTSSAPTPLLERSLVIIPAATSEQTDTKRSKITAQGVELSRLQNEHDILEFSFNFQTGSFSSENKLRNYLEHKSINLNDQFFLDTFSVNNFIKLTLYFTKILTEFNLNLNTENYINLMCEKLNLVRNYIDIMSLQSTMRILNLNPILEVNHQYNENVKEILNTIEFFASQTSTDDIKNCISSWEPKSVKDKAINAFEQGRSERVNTRQELQKELNVHLLKDISLLITDYNNESPDKVVVIPPGTPATPDNNDPSCCCVIL